MRFEGPRPSKCRPPTRGAYHRRTCGKSRRSAHRSRRRRRGSPRAWRRSSSCRWRRCLSPPRRGRRRLAHDALAGRDGPWPRAGRRRRVVLMGGPLDRLGAPAGWGRAAGGRDVRGSFRRGLGSHAVSRRRGLVAGGRVCRLGVGRRAGAASTASGAGLDWDGRGDLRRAGGRRSGAVGRGRARACGPRAGG